MKKSWKKLSSKVVLKNPWFTVRQDKVVKPDGKSGQFNVVMRKPSVYIVPINEKGQICLIGLHRYPTNTYSIEIPAGSTDGQNSLTAAKRELKEETGLIAKSWVKIGKFEVANGILDEIGHIYLAKQITQTNINEQREEGITKLIYVSYKKALQMIEEGQIVDGQTIVALHYAKNRI